MTILEGPGGTPPSPPEVGSVVHITGGAGRATRIDGFVITNGSAIGGGICIVNYDFIPPTISHPVIIDNKIHDNSAGEGGGGIAVIGSERLVSYDPAAPVISRNIISQNRSSSNGGGIGCFGHTAPSITNNHIVANAAADNENSFYRGGGEVWVAGGTYTERNSLQAFIYLYGGFAGNETDRSQRNIAANPTILDGDGIPNVLKAERTGYLVSAIDGFTIRNGVVVMEGLPSNPTTDPTGYYSDVAVPAGWSGTVTPKKPGFTFSPPSRAYDNIASDQYEQNYTATGGLAEPAVTTAAVKSVTSTGASSGGNVISDGGAEVTACGVCWGFAPNPTTSGSHTVDGSGAGPFTSQITGLMAGMTSCLRAYATNSVGTSYGEQYSFCRGDAQRDEGSENHLCGLCRGGRPVLFRGLVRRQCLDYSRNLQRRFGWHLGRPRGLLPELRHGGLGQDGFARGYDHDGRPGRRRD